MLAMVVFASSALVFREAVDARPYMTGLLAQRYKLSLTVDEGEDNRVILHLKTLTT